LYGNALFVRQDVHLDYFLFGLLLINRTISNPIDYENKQKINEKSMLTHELILSKIVTLTRNVQQGNTTLNLD